MSTKNQKTIISLLGLNIAIVFILLIQLPGGQVLRPALLSNVQNKASMRPILASNAHYRPIQRVSKSCQDRLSTIWLCTAFCPCERCCGRFSDGITASGHKIRSGDRFVAAPCEIPFGTLVRVPGYNDGQPVPVLDRGRLITGNHIDVFFNSHDDALKWGIQRLEVEICLQDG